MYCSSSATENIMMEVPQKIPISAFFATNAFYVIYFLLFNRPGVPGACNHFWSLISNFDPSARVASGGGFKIIYFEMLS